MNLLKAYTYDYKVFSKSSFKMSNIMQNIDPFKNELSITFPMSTIFAFNQLFLKNDNPTFIDIYRGHVHDGEFKRVWKGRVIGRELSGTAISMLCESDFTRLNSIGLRSKYEHICRHALYSPQCGVNKSSFAFSGTVSSYSATSLNMTGLNAYADGYFDAGFILINVVRRFIQKHTGNNLILMSEYNSDVLGLSGTVYAGCKRDLSTCHNKFSNSINFGGFPYIPIRNPFEGSPY